MSKSLRNTILFIIAGISFLMHFKHFSKDLVSIHVWRQTQTQSTIDNFYEEDMNLFNPRRNDRGAGDGLFRMEFPLMQWLVAVQYKLFGKHLIISRLFMFVIGLFSMLGVYKLLDALFEKPVLALIGAWALTFSPCFFYYTINPLPDNMALCSSIWGLVFFFKWLKNKKWLQLFFGSAFLSIGALCKLPFMIYYIVPLSYFLRSIYKSGIDVGVIKQVLTVFFCSTFPLLWYASVIPQWGGNPIVKGMLENNESTSKLLEYFEHTLISTLPELLLNYGSLLFFLAGFYYLYKRKAFHDSRFFLFIALSFIVSAYYLFEANAIAKIHDYYLFPFFPLLFILVGYGGYHLYMDGRFKRYLSIFLLSILPFTCFLRMQGRWDLESPGFNVDLLTYKEELRNIVPNDELVIVGNDESHFIFFYYIDKKGWGFHNDNLTASDLKSLISQGAKYIYTDSNNIYNNPSLNMHFGELISEKGSIRIYRLKNI